MINLITLCINFVLKKIENMSTQTTVSLATVEQAQEMGLRPEEFGKIKEILGRTPNFTELSVFGVMWSEHCSYKNSIVWLKHCLKMVHIC